jgi:glutamate-ammonia-ligase adenylyltransferase
MLCVSLDSFAQYQREEAWVWEHMALTRARVVYGPCEGAEGIIAGILEQPRDATALRKDIIAMRAEMAEHKPPKGALDVKLCAGGLVDAEFCIHALQLTHQIGYFPQLERAALSLSDTGLLPDDFGPAQALLTRLLVLLRLVAPDCETPPQPAQALVATALGYDHWDAMVQAVEAAKALISGVWQSYKSK